MRLRSKGLPGIVLGGVLFASPLFWMGCASAPAGSGAPRVGVGGCRGAADTRMAGGSALHDAKGARRKLF